MTVLRGWISNLSGTAFTAERFRDLQKMPVTIRTHSQAESDDGFG